ncbi:MAG TPA: P-loop NTPase [Methanoregulaceae archaeon]|nr:P-loop NTPase [Methanoregulaceae archaeon]
MEGGPLWKLSPEHPPIITFYSFKGGVGRSTILAAVAIQLAHEGKRIAVLDMDLDAPGVGRLLTDDPTAIPAWGIIDYLLEAPLGPVDVTDYLHRCTSAEIAGSGEIIVFPAGTINQRYPEKLSRIDLDLPLTIQDHGFASMLDAVREHLSPDFILIDARSGLSDVAGLVLAEISHLAVLIGTGSDQSWQGLTYVIHRMGAEHLHRELPQQDCVLVQAMIPEVEPAPARTAFQGRALDVFSEEYYAPDPEDPDEYDDQVWYIGDQDDELAPHREVSITYKPKLAFYHELRDVAETLNRDTEYRALTEKITVKFRRTK